MNELQSKFIELATKYELLKDEMKLVKEQLDKTMADMGVNTYLQDPITGLVYKIYKPEGRFVYYSELDYVRTAKPDEARGSLSKKEAEMVGFKLGR